MNTISDTNIIENLAAEYALSLQKERSILTEEEAKRTGYPMGHIIKYTPHPENPEQAFERLKKGYAQIVSESLQRDFTYTYPVIPSNIESELKSLEDFIKNAEEKAKDANSMKIAFSIAPNKVYQINGSWLDIKNDEQLEYIRLARGFYTLHMCDDVWNSKASRVYGKYFLYRQWLIRQLANAKPEEPSISNPIAVTCSLQVHSVTQGSLALYYYYCHEKKCLPPFPAGAMIKAYIDATTPYNLSWKAFQQKYSRFKNRNERLAEGNRNALMGAIEMLKTYPDALSMAQDELKVAETRNPLT